MMNSTLPMEDMLTALTEAVLRGDRELHRIGRRYGVTQAEVDQYAPLVQSLRDVHRTPAASPKYVRKLKRELMGAPEYTLVERVRYLPPRVQIAAGVAVGATFGVLVIGRLTVILFRLASGRATMRDLRPVSAP